MALGLFSESWAAWPPVSSPSGVASPRISFSRDLDSPTAFDDHFHNHRSDSSLLDSSPEFDFCVSHDRSDHESSIADELFSGGVLLPLPLLPRGGTSFPPPSLPTRSSCATTTFVSGGSSSRSRLHHASPPATVKPTPLASDWKDHPKEIIVDTGNGGGAGEDKSVPGKQPASFWRFGRSSSLNCGGGGAGAGAVSGRRASLIRSLPLLSRSKSTGSNPSPSTLKQRHQPFNNAASASTVGGGGGGTTISSSKLCRKGSGNGGAATRNSYYYGHHHHGSGGVRISPVLNVPPPYIPKGGAAGIFGLGHLLCNGKDRSRKKAAAPPTSP